MSAIPSKFQSNYQAAHQAVKRFLATYNVNFLHEAVQSMDQILKSEEFTQLPNDFQVAVLHDMANNWVRLYQSTNECKYVFNAISMYSECRGLVKVGHKLFATIYCNLGQALFWAYRCTGDESYVDVSIDSCEVAVEAAKIDDSESDLALALNNLGMSLQAQYESSGTNHPESLEKSIEALQECRLIVSKGHPFVELHGVLNNLATMLSHRYERFGKVRDLETAVKLWEESLEASQNNEYLQFLNLSNLGIGMSKLYFRSRQLEYLHKAIGAFTIAINNAPSIVANLLPDTMANLAEVLRRNFAETGQTELLENAIELLQATKSNTPLAGQQMILKNLALSLFTRFIVNKDLEDLKEAISVGNNLISIISQDSPLFAAACNDLGNSLFQYYQFTQDPNILDDSIILYERAIAQETKIFKNALGGTDQIVDSETINTMRHNLGRCYLERFLEKKKPEDIESAILTFEEALLTLNQAFSILAINYQLGQQTRWNTLFQLTVTCYLYAAKTWPSHSSSWHLKSLVLAEANKSRILALLMARNNLLLPLKLKKTELRISDIQLKKLLKDEQELVQKLRDIDAVELSMHEMADTRGDRSKFYRQEMRHDLIEALFSLWKELEAVSTEFANYVSLRRGDAHNWETLRELIRKLGAKSALISFYETGSETIMFFLSANSNYPTMITFDDRVLEDFVRRIKTEIFEGHSSRGETWQAEWKAKILPLIDNTIPQLKDAEQIIVIPQGKTGILPWNALAIYAGWKGTVSIFPNSMAMLYQVEKNKQRTEVLVVGNPSGPWNNLPFAEDEAEQVAELLNSKPIIGNSATKSTVLERMGRSKIAHFATHAFFGDGENHSPLDSGIYLANGEVLTVREIISTGLQAPELVVISACQSGLSGSIGGNELAGLTQALLYAGTRSILVSQWKIDDASTGYLMTDFYRNWLVKGQKKSLALRNAILNTKNEKPEWTHTYYWGAFVCVGEW